MKSHHAAIPHHLVYLLIVEEVSQQASPETESPEKVVDSAEDTKAFSFAGLCFRCKKKHPLVGYLDPDWLLAKRILQAVLGDRKLLIQLFQSLNVLTI